MASQKELKEYLVGENGYLKNSNNNNKVIMLSGKWGSGKTHFWQNLIATDELKKELKDKREIYSYISLYGKTSIEEIENDIFSQAYYSAIGGENFITKGFSTFTKRMKRFGNSKIANGLREEQKDNIERTALSRLNNGGIICFDDFERKSKEIDLNDLFGFITQLSLNFKCKVVIILNDDVFEDEEKDIFSNVKEKTVSKYLYYNPSIEELFTLVFKNGNKYEKLNEYRELILKTIEKTKELNARIYIQVLDNLLEWIEKSTIDKKREEVLRYLILVNINFILYHTIYEEIEKYPYLTPKEFYLFIDNKHINSAVISSIQNTINAKFFLHELKRVVNSNVNFSSLKDSYLKIIEENKNILSSVFFLEKYLRGIPREKFISEINKINKFIETGILIKEDA